MIPHLRPFELEIKIADEDEIFRKQHEELTLFCLFLKQNRKHISSAVKFTHAKPSESAPFYPVHFCIILHGICEKPSKLSSVI